MADAFKAHADTFLASLDRLIAEARRGTAYLAKTRLQLGGPGLSPVTLWMLDSVGQAAPPPAAMDLGTGLAGILMSTAQPAARAVSSPAEWVFVAHHADEQQVFRTLRRLARRATPARVSSVARSDGSRFWLVHVLAERRRPSGLPGLIAGGSFEGWARLACHPTRDVRVFLPHDVTPRPDIFARVSSLLDEPATQSVLGLEPQGPNGERLAIIVPFTGEANRFEFPKLPKQAFRDGADLVHAVGVDVRRTPVAVDRPPQHLIARLANEAGTRGYRLALRPVHQNGSDEFELRRLRQHQAELEQRVAYFESIVRQRPRLLRFANDQLRALAHVLYTFPVDALTGPHPKVTYAFQASERDPEGRHYLLIAPDAVRQGADPLPRYVGPRMKFWLDPSWSRYYHDDQQTRSLVFVPDRSALFPSLHTWSIQEIDAHLERLFASPSPAGAAGGAPRIFLFDQAGDDGGLEVTVLDRAAFVAVGTSLRWLNDNLTVATARARSAAVRKGAAAITLERTVSDAVLQFGESHLRFTEAKQHALRQFAADFDEIVSEIEQGTQAVLQRAREAEAASQNLAERTRRLADVQARGEVDLANLSELPEQLAKAAVAVTDEVRRIETLFVVALKTAKVASDSTDRELKGYVVSLQALKARLLELIRSEQDKSR